MPLENADATERPSASAPRSTTAGPTPAVVDLPMGTSIHQDVERLIQIAGHLFAAIERQIRSIEVDLMFAQSDVPILSSVTVFKEQLIRSANSLDASLREIAQHLSEGPATSNESAHQPRVSLLD
jgi:hypothetical protein